MNGPASLASVMGKIRRLAAKIEAPKSLIPRTAPSAWGEPHIEVDRFYHLVVCERGQEFERRTTSDLDELLYWVFEGVTSSMGFDYELAHRRPEEDSRRIAFAKQLEMLNSLRPAWAERCRAELATIVARYPFDDSAYNGLQLPLPTQH